MIGNINALVQVVNNLIQNAIQAYNGKENQSIDMVIDRENEKIVISVADNAGGIPKEVRNELFSKMVTTKGHNGSGLGLFMSYSTIKGNFKGDMTFDVREGEGTTFKIILPNDLEKVKLGASKEESGEETNNENN
jgi:C4-dicarboxylate-specific signal transduction histidine kinase